MMTGHIHTVYPRTSVSMKMGSPLKTVGVLDTDVSTAVAGRVGLTTSRNVSPSVHSSSNLNARAGRGLSRGLPMKFGRAMRRET